MRQTAVWLVVEPRMELIVKKNRRIYVQMTLEIKWICPIQLGSCTLCVYKRSELAKNFLF